MRSLLAWVMKMTVAASRVLIVEDEAELLDEVASCLRRRGETVLTATSYAKATRIFADATEAFDVLITDARMADGNGVDLIRAESRRGAPRVCILMTGNLEQTDSAVEMPGVQVLHKPFAVFELYREMRAALAAQTEAR